MYQGDKEIYKKGVSTRFKTGDSRTREAALKSNAVQAERRANTALIDAFLADLLDMAFKECSLEEFKRKATEAPTQALRVMALNLANPKTSMAALEAILDRAVGKPKQRVEQQLNASLEGHEKPVIVFTHETK